jgi:transcription elongation factor Elf1
VATHKKVKSAGSRRSLCQVCGTVKTQVYTRTVQETTVLGIPVRRRTGHYYVTCPECGWRTQLGVDLPEELKHAR